MRILYFILVLVLISACTKVDIPTPIPPVVDIFSVTQSSVSDGQEISFNLKTDGIYTLTIGNPQTNQVLTRERFAGKAGQNKLTIYTKSLPVTYLYLLLEDVSKAEVSKTTIIIK